MANEIDSTPLMIEGGRCRRASTITWSQDVKKHREDTNIKMDLLGRTLSATMQLATWSFEYARVRKVNCWRWRCETIPCLSRWLQKMPDLNDFIRAYNLIHDWYPKLHEEVRIHRRTWADCNKDVLKSMQKLVNAERISGDKDAFCRWAEDKLKENQEQQSKEHEKAEAVLSEMKALLDRNVIRSESDPGNRDVFRKMLDTMIVKSNRETQDSIEEQQPSERDEQEQGCCKKDCCKKDFDDVRQNLQAMYALVCGPEGGGNKSAGYWLLALKMPILRVMWIILMLDFFLLYQASALGLLTQIFLELNVKIDRPDKWTILLLVSLPLAFIVYSICGTVLGNLVHGSFQYPPFQWARARFIIFLTPGILCGRDLDRRRLWLIDMFFTDALLLSIVSGGLLFAFWSRLQGDDSWLDCILCGLNWGAFCWTCSCVVLTGVARWYCNLWLETHIIEQAHSGHPPFTCCGFQYLPHCLRQYLPKLCLDEDDIANIVFRPTRCSSILMDAFQTYGILPGEMSTYFLCLQRVLQIHRHDDQEWNVKQVEAWVNKENESMNLEEGRLSWQAYSKKLATWDSLLLVSDDSCAIKSGMLSIVAWIVTMLVCTTLDITVWWVLLATTMAITITVGCLTVACEHSMPVLTGGRWFRIHGVVFILLIIFFSVFTTQMIGGPESLSPLMTKSNSLGNSSKTRGVFYNHGNDDSLVTPYPACSMSWGSRQAKVGILDLAAMAYYAYSERQHEFADLLNKSFDSAEVVKWSDFKEIPRVVAARMCPNTSGTGPCTLIVAVKGTSNKLEIMIDVGIFSTVSILQMLDMVAPLLGTLPMRLVASIIDRLRLPFMKQTQRKWSRRLETAVKELQENYSHDSLVITGHSLGGNFAELAGARLNIPSVGFSAPGQYYLMESFELGHGQDAVAQNVMTVIPRMDAIPHVATHVDVIQKILCRKADGKFRSPTECHSIEATSCELWRVCGDKQERNFSQKCLEKNPNSTIKEPLVNEMCVGQVFHHNTSAPCHLLSASQ